MSIKITKDLFISRSNLKHNNKYDYSKLNFVGMKTKIVVICPKHGDYICHPKKHISGNGGCRKCQYESVSIHNKNNSKNRTIKRKQTCLIKYGDENFTNREQAKETKFNLYGDENFTNREQAKETCLRHYGVDNPFKSKEIFLASIGYENPAFSPEIQDKKFKPRSKRYTFPSGNSYCVQGNEPQAIELLLTQGYIESDLLLKNRPSIKYEWEGKTKYYHPDIVIPKENRIIEVKSKYWYERELDKNLAKQKGSINAGWNHEFMIID